MMDVYREQEIELAQQFTWMYIFLERTDTIAVEEKQKIWEELKMLDRLWDESPRVQQTLARGVAQGQLETSRSFVVTVVKVRFPTLTSLAEQKVSAMERPEALRKLLEQLSAASNEDEARSLLLPMFS